MKYAEPTAEQIAGYQSWLALLPPRVRAVARRFNPWTVYRLKTTGHRVLIYSFSSHDEDPVTLTVGVSALFNLVVFERAVFGIKPEDLEECELPAPDEPVGMTFDYAKASPKEREEFVNKMRRAMQDRTKEN